MLKHKIRKSRKNILSLLDYANEHEDDGKFPEYSEIKKPSRKEQKKKKGTYLNHQLGIINHSISCLQKQQFASIVSFIADTPNNPKIF